MVHSVLLAHKKGTSDPPPHEVKWGNKRRAQSTTQIQLEKQCKNVQ